MLVGQGQRGAEVVGVVTGVAAVTGFVGQSVSEFIGQRFAGVGQLAFEFQQDRVAVDVVLVDAQQWYETARFVQGGADLPLAVVVPPGFGALLIAIPAVAGGSGRLLFPLGICKVDLCADPA